MNSKTITFFIMSGIIILALFSASFFHSCRDARRASPVTATKFIPGTPDTSKQNIPVSGHAILSRNVPAEMCVLNPADVPAKSDTLKALPSNPEGSRVTYSGVIKDSTFNLTVSAVLDTLSGTLNLEYEGSVLQKTVSRVDTLFSNTVVTEETPWYKTAYAGAAYASTIILTIIYLLLR